MITDKLRADDSLHSDYFYMIQLLLRTFKVIDYFDYSSLEGIIYSIINEFYNFNDYYIEMCLNLIDLLIRRCEELNDKIMKVYFNKI